MKQQKISDLKFDKRNANKGTQRGAYMLEKSLQDFGAGRSVLIDKNNVIMCGNKTIEQAGQIGMEDMIVVETDGTKLVAVKRTDLDLTKDKKARKLAVADNRVSQIDLEWDVTQLLQDHADVDLSDFWKQEELDELLKQVGDSLDIPDTKEQEQAKDDMIHCPKCGFKWAK